MRSVVALLVSSGWLLAPALARAQPAPNRPFGVATETPAPAAPARVAVQLDYTRGPGASDACPDERGLRGAVAALMGYDPFAPDARQAVHARITRQGATFVALMERRDASGRVLWSRPGLADPDCNKLVGAMALLMAPEIDPAQPNAAPSPPPAGQVTPATPPAQTAPRDEIAAPPTSSTRPGVRLGVRAGVSIGTLPAAAPMIAADAGVRWEYFSISAEGRADLPVTATVDTGVRLRASLLAASVVPCGHYGWFAGCAVVSVGSLRAEGIGVPRTAGGSAVYAVAGLRAGIEWPIPRLEAVALRASAEALVTLHPIEAARIDDREVWRTPPFAGLFGGGLVTRF